MRKCELVVFRSLWFWAEKTQKSFCRRSGGMKKRYFKNPAWKMKKNSRKIREWREWRAFSSFRIGFFSVFFSSQLIWSMTQSEEWQKIRRKGNQKMKVLIQFALFCLDFHFSRSLRFAFADKNIDPFCNPDQSFFFHCVHLIKTPEEIRRKNEQTHWADFALIMVFSFLKFLIYFLWPH